LVHLEVDGTVGVNKFVHTYSSVDFEVYQRLHTSNI